MFGEFLNIIFRSIRLDKTLYSDNKNFTEASIYFAGLIMILDGIAGAVAANTVIKTAIGMSGLTAIITWFIWAIFIFVIGVKIFPDKQTKVPFKKVLTVVILSHRLRFFAVTPELIPIIFLTQFDFCSFNNIYQTNINQNQISNLLELCLSFLIIAILSISFVASRMNALQLIIFRLKIVLEILQDLHILKPVRIKFCKTLSSFSLHSSQILSISFWFF